MIHQAFLAVTCLPPIDRVEADDGASLNKSVASAALPQMASGYQGFQNRSFIMAKMKGWEWKLITEWFLLVWIVWGNKSRDLERSAL